MAERFSFEDAMKPPKAGGGERFSFEDAIGQPQVKPDAGSFLENLAAGVGGAISDLGLGIKQRYVEAADAIGKKVGISDEFDKAILGTTAADEVKKARQEVVEKRKMDAPLLDTVGGKVGNIVGTALPALGAALIPGGQTLTGSLVAGGVLGAAQPTVEGESAIKNAALGAGGGAVGYGVGKGVAVAAEKIAASNASKAAANAGKDAIASQSHKAGYVIPPVQSNPSLVNKALEGLSGKISTGQAASIKNQVVTNKMAAASLGLDPEKPITKEVLDSVRANAGQAYEAIKARGAFVVDDDYLRAVADIGKKNELINKSFPGIRGGGMHGDPVEGVIHSLTPNGNELRAEATIEAIKQLRFQASGNLKNFQDPVKVDLGKAQKKAADALESLIDRNLAKSGDEGLLKAFRGARQTIAKTYTVEKALNDSTGNVAAGKLAKELSKGKPLSGELKTIAEFGQSFPKAAQEITSSMPGVSPLDFFGAGGLSAITGNPLAMAAAGIRPLVRSTILSRPYQATMGVPSYENAIARALGSDQARIGLQAGGMLLLPELLK
jgi:hypothetical protein